MRTSFLIAVCLAVACAAAGSNQEKIDASNDPHDAATSKQDAQAIDAAKPPIDAAEPPPIDAPAVGPDASDIGANCFFNSQCPDTNTCCFFGQCAVGVAGANNTCIP